MVKNMQILWFFHVVGTIWCQWIREFSILEIQGHKGQKGRYSSYKQKIAQVDVKSSKVALVTFRGNFYSIQKANLDGEVAESHFKEQNVPWRSEN